MESKCSKCGNLINQGETICNNCKMQEQAVIEANVQNQTPVQVNQNIQNNTVNNVQQVQNINTNQPVQQMQNVNVNQAVQQVPLQQNNQNIKQNNKKPKKKRSGCLTVLLIFIILIVLLVIVIKVITKSKEPLEYEPFQKDYPYMALTDDNLYTISNAEEDIYFYVTSGTKYKVTDEKGNEVETVIENNKITNPNKYEKGKKYTITLTEGKFLSSQLEESKKVEFKIKRDEVKKYKYSSNTKIVNKKDIKSTTENKFTSKNKYSVGDVIVIGTKDDIASAYYITNVSGNEYEYRNAKINEIYQELDYYYEAPVDLSNIEISDQIKEYVANNVENSQWYKTLVEEVHAAPPITIDIVPKDNGVEATVKIKVTPNQNALIINPKNHSLEITFKQFIYIECLTDITLTNWDVTFNLTSKQKFDFKIKNKLYEFQDADTKDATKELITKLKEVIEKGEASDSSSKDADLAKIIIPLGIPGLNVTLDLELVSTVTISADLGLSMGNTTNIVVGFDYGVGEEFKFIGSYDKDYDDTVLSFSGKVEEKLGVKLKLGVELIGVVNLNVSAGTGVYESFETSINYTPGKKDSFDLTFKAQSGIYLDFAVGAELVESLKYEHTFASKKWPIFGDEKISTKDFSQEATGGTNQEQGGTGGIFDYNEIDPLTGMPIMRSEEERLERYSCVDSTEDESYIKYKYNYKNGKFNGVEMTGVYYIDTGIEAVDNFLRLIIQILSILFKVYYNFGTYYYEVGNYSYIVVPLREEDMATEFGDINYEDYYTFKAAMDEQGMICK